MHIYTSAVDFNMQALLDICHKVLRAVHKGPGSRAAVKLGSTVTKEEGCGSSSSGASSATVTSKEKPFDSMNSIVANLLLNMTRLKPWFKLPSLV